MAFLIAIDTPEGAVHYWLGGDVTGENGADAARFMTQGDANGTIDLLQSAIGLSSTARAVDLGEVM